MERTTANWSELETVQTTDQCSEPKMVQKSGPETEQLKVSPTERSSGPHLEQSLGLETEQSSGPEREGC